MNLITAKIDVKKIDKARLFQGKTGLYLDVVLVPIPQSKFDDDYMVVQQVSKDERHAGVKGNILGNARIMDAARSPKPPTPAEPARSAPSTSDEDIPF